MVAGLICGLVLLGGGILLAGNRLRELDWMYCPESPADYQFGSILYTDHHRYPFVGLVFYSYAVACKTYRGTCARYFLSSQEAQRFLADCDVSDLFVRYKPENPQEARLFTKSRLVQHDSTTP